VRRGKLGRGDVDSLCGRLAQPRSLHPASGITGYARATPNPADAKSLCSKAMVLIAQPLEGTRLDATIQAGVGCTRRSTGDPSLAPAARFGARRGAKNLVRGVAAPPGAAATLLADQNSGGPGSSPSGGVQEVQERKNWPPSGGRFVARREQTPREDDKAQGSIGRRPGASRAAQRTFGGSKAWKPGGRSRGFGSAIHANGRQARALREERPALRKGNAPEGCPRSAVGFGRSGRGRAARRGGLPSRCDRHPGEATPG
jgi:hypothetical protein